MKTYSSEQTETLEILEGIREAYPHFFEVGADYNRTIKTLWSDSKFCAEKGDMMCARHFLQQCLDLIEQETSRLGASISHLRGENES